MSIKNFKPAHIEAESSDFQPINGMERYVILCGSDARAKLIANQFNTKLVRHSSRGHHFYTGFISFESIEIPIASISTGMGTPSADIIINELYLLGARRFLRIGTAGSLQPEHIKTGSVVIATAAVRDECTSNCYIYPEYPAVASSEMTSCLINAANKLGSDQVFKGIIHTKSSLYAREMNQSFLSENKRYMENLKLAGVLATEMECSLLFILSSLHNKASSAQLNSNNDMICGAILAIVGDSTPFSDTECANEAIERAIEIGLHAIKLLAVQEFNAQIK